jgi:uroporphyrinogen decarboxylase
MNSRERILMALGHKEPDRVPIDLGGCRASGIMGIAYNELKRYLGIEKDRTRIYDFGQQLALPEEDLLKRFNVDVRPVCFLPDCWKRWTLPDGSECEIPCNSNPEKENGSFVLKGKSGIITARMPDNGYYFDTVYHPLKDTKEINDIEEYLWQYEYDKKEVENLRNKAKALYENTDYALMLDDAGSIYECAQELRGWDSFLMDLVSNQKFAEYLLDKITEVKIELAKQLLEAVGDYVQVIQIGDDLGTQDAPQISPALYRKIIKPRHKKLCEFIKSVTNAYLLIHSCGSVYDFIPDFIDIGIDVFNPVQVSAKNMDSKRLKKEFGNDISFWGGGCDTQKVLPFGNPEQVRMEVRKRIDDLAPGGGFVFNQVHNIQADVPSENIMAMYEAVMEYGKY